MILMNDFKAEPEELRRLQQLDAPGPALEELDGEPVRLRERRQQQKEQAEDRRIGEAALVELVQSA